MNTPLSSQADTTEPLRPPAPRRNPCERWITFFLIAGILWRLARFALHFPFRGDEAKLGLGMMERHFTDLNGALRFEQMTPPLFLVISQALRLACSSSEWVLRTLPLVAGLAALFMFFFWARRWLEPLGLALALALVAVSSIPVQFSADFKPYALDLCFGVLYLHLAWRFLHDPAPWRNSWWLIPLAPLAILLSFPSVLLFGALSLLLLPRVLRGTSWACKAGYLAANLLAAAAVIYLRLGMDSPRYREVSAFMQDYWVNGFPPAQFSGFLVWLYKSHIRGILSYPYNNHDIDGCFVALFVIAGIVGLCRQRKLKALSILLLPFLLSFVTGCLHLYPYGSDTRLQQHLAPAVFVLAGTGMVALAQAFHRLRPQRLMTLLSHVFLILLSAVVFLGIIHDIRYPYFRSINDQLARAQVQALPAQIPEGIPIYLNNPQEDIPAVFLWYLRTNRVVITDVLPPNAPAPATAFCVLDTTVDGKTSPPLPPGESTLILDQTFLASNVNVIVPRRCRLYFFQFPPVAESPRPQPISGPH